MSQDRLAFERIHKTNKLSQYIVYGYLRHCQFLIPSNNPYYNLDRLISYTILLYFDEPDYFSVCNNSTFRYAARKHGNYYHVVSTKRIVKGHINNFIDDENTYKWIVETDRWFCGRIGIIDDSENSNDIFKLVLNSNALKQGVSIVGSQYKHWKGRSMQDTNNMNALDGVKFHGFIRPNDVLQIDVNWTTHIIRFRSAKSGRIVTDVLPMKVTAVRLIAEFAFEDSMLTLRTGVYQSSVRSYSNINNTILNGSVVAMGVQSKGGIDRPLIPSSDNATQQNIACKCCTCLVM